MKHLKRFTCMAMAAAMALSLAACGGTPSDAGGSGSEAGSGDQKTIVVGTSNFTEVNILGEIYTELIEANTDYEVEQRFGLSGAAMCFDALEQGSIDMFVEYTGTALLNLLAQPMDTDKDRVWQTVHDLMLEEHGIQGIEYASTAGAAKKVAEEKEKTHGAIASTRAAEVFGLDVLQERINYQSTNFTRFIIISNQKVFLKDANKISVAFEVKHVPGALYNMLANFYYNEMNLTKIESRPLHGKKWEYRFFVDLEGNLNESAVENALATMHECASNLKVLGNFETK